MNLTGISTVVIERKKLRLFQHNVRGQSVRHGDCLSRWIYRAVILPTVSYGLAVWNTALYRASKSNKKLFCS